MLDASRLHGGVRSLRMHEVPVIHDLYTVYFPYMAQVRSVKKRAKRLSTLRPLFIRDYYVSRLRRRLDAARPQRDQQSVRNRLANSERRELAHAARRQASGA